MAIQGSTDLITKKFYTGIDAPENYYDVTNLTITILDNNKKLIRQIPDTDINHTGTGVYTYKLTYDTGYNKIILVYNWTENELDKVERIEIPLSYTTGSLQVFSSKFDTNSLVVDNKPISGNTDTLTKKFYTINSDKSKTYYDVTNFTVQLYTKEKVKISDLSYTKSSTGIYDIIIPYPDDYQEVVLKITWIDSLGCTKVERFNIDLDYINSKATYGYLGQNSFTPTSHLHDNKNILDLISIQSGELAYNGKIINPIDDAKTLTTSTWSSSAIQGKLDTKVDKATGKGLSTNDLTDVLKLNYNSAYSHIFLTGNPHNLVKSDIGLSNVDNTSDDNKSISIATQTALNTKVNKTTTINGYALSENIIITKTDLGINNVDNTSDVNKPVSTATQAALDKKVNNTGDENISGIKTFNDGIKLDSISEKIADEGVNLNKQLNINMVANQTGYAFTVNNSDNLSLVSINTSGQIYSSQSQDSILNGKGLFGANILANYSKYSYIKSAVNTNITSEYIAIKFTLPAGYKSIGQVYIDNIGKTSNLNDDALVSATIYSDNNGVPSTTVYSNGVEYIYAHDVTTIGLPHAFPMNATSQVYSEGQVYWIVFKFINVVSGNFTIKFGALETPTNCYSSGHIEGNTSGSTISWGSLISTSITFRLYTLTGNCITASSIGRPSILASNISNSAILGVSTYGNGLYGSSTASSGVLGVSSNGYGGRFYSVSGAGGLRAYSTYGVGAIIEQNGSFSGKDITKSTLSVKRTLTTTSAYTATESVVEILDSTAFPSPLIKCIKQGSTVFNLDSNGNLSITGSIKTNTIVENTTDSGVTIDGVLIKDNIVTTTGTSITLQQTGDTYGTTRLILTNRVGANGATFENLASGSAGQLVDFIFKNTLGQRNIRLEGRSGSTKMGTSQEWGFGDYSLEDNPHTVMSTTGLRQISGTIQAVNGLLSNTIAEYTTNAGVTIDGILLKDNQINIVDTNTQIYRDVSNNLIFKDSENIGGITLSEISQPTIKYIQNGALSSGVYVNLTDTNWGINKAVINLISIVTLSTNWDLYIACDTDETSGLFPAKKIMTSANGNKDIMLNGLPYINNDSTSGVILKFIDNSGSNSATVSVYGVKAR